MSDAAPPAPSKKRNKRILIVVGVVVGLVVLAAVAGPFVYINFIKDDAPDAFTLDDAPAATAATTATGPSSGTDPAGGATTAAPGDATGIDGTWIVDGTNSQVGYRVVEVLFGQDTEGVGRTSDVTGEMTIAGTQVTAGSFEADMTTVQSDENRRDNQFNNRLMSTGEFPTATFTLTAPIELGSVPADGESISAQATGDLTLRGTTKSVTMDVQAQLTGATIQVVGSTDILFADYGIPMPDVPGITTQDHGLLEFDLHLTRS